MEFKKPLALTLSLPLLSEMPDPKALSLSLSHQPRLLLLPLSQQRKTENQKQSQLPLWRNLLQGEVNCPWCLGAHPWTRAELRALAKEFPKASQDPPGFAKEFELTIRTYEPSFADLYQLI